MSYLYTSERSQMYNRPLFFARVAGGPLRASQPPLAFQAKGGAQVQDLPGLACTPLDLRVKGETLPLLTPFLSGEKQPAFGSMVLRKELIRFPA